MVTHPDINLVQQGLTFGELTGTAVFPFGDSRTTTHLTSGGPALLYPRGEAVGIK